MATTTKAKAMADWLAKKRGPKRTPTQGDKWFSYEYRKKCLPPNLSPSEYEEAINKIKTDLGI